MTEALWGQVIVASVAVAGSVFGYVLAGFNDARRDSRAAERERRTRSEDRYEAALAAQHALQLETLLALQDSVQAMGRLTYRAIHHDYVSAFSGQSDDLPPELDQDLLSNGVDVHRLRERLLDPSLRNSIALFATSCNMATLTQTDRTTGAPSPHRQAITKTNKHAERVNAVMDELGTALRIELAHLPKAT